MIETERRGIPFGTLLAIPEKDDWVYSDGSSTTCVAFILQMYKEAGLFGSLSKSIQVTEFTVSLYKAFIVHFYVLMYMCSAAHLGVSQIKRFSISLII